MIFLKTANPFNAPVYYEETVESTMDISRKLAQNKEPHGTVIVSDFQKAGRGRIKGRQWLMEKGESLAFTILLRYQGIEQIPCALTLRIGLAVSLAIEDYAPLLSGKVMVKWPNDIIIDSKKAAGILCEADGENVFAGIGINMAQKEFPLSIAEKAISIALAAGENIDPDKRFCLLEKILVRLYNELETEEAKKLKARLEQRLYKKDEQVTFIQGAADSGKEIKGRLAGISETGELLIAVNEESEPRSFTTGELI